MNFKKTAFMEDKRLNFRLAGPIGLACLLPLLLLLIFSGTARAQYHYTTADGKITIVTYSGSGGVVSIPSVIANKPVVGVGSKAFSGCTSLTNVTIPNSVTCIGGSAFSGCTNLEGVAIGTSVTSIGNSAFNGCTSLLSVAIPNSVTSIGNSTFTGCTSLVCATIGNGVTAIESNAFNGCTSLASVTIGNSVTSIGSRAFYWCTSLTDLTIPSRVTSIGDSAFDGCTNLANVTIPNKVSSIAEYAFADCTGLTCITLPNKLTSIAQYTFSGCSSLANVTIPDSVTSIGDCAFFWCTSLTGITIPKNVASIAYDAFSDCSSLASAVFTGNAPALQSGVFDYAASGFTVYCFNAAQGFTFPAWNGYAANNVVVSPSGTDLAVTGTAGTSFSYQIVAPDTDIATFYETTGLPPGLSCNSVTGLISGTPTTSGTFNGTLMIGNPAGSGTGALTMDVEPTALTVTNGPVTKITKTGAVLSGTINPGGEAASYYFDYGVTADFGRQTKTISVAPGVADIALSATLAQLSSGTDYCYQLVAVSASGTSCGEIATFTTSGAPQADTGSAVASTVRTLVTGAVNPDAAATSVYFQYGVAASSKTVAYKSITPAQAAGAGREWINFSATLTGLKQGTTYHYRIVAQNSNGTTAGGDEEFTTPGTAPSFSAIGSGTGVSVTGTGESFAEVNAQVDSQSSPANVSFQYGPTSSYGKTTTVAAFAGGSACTASATLCGLAPHTTYYVREVDGKSYIPGEFKTLPRFDMNGDGLSDVLLSDTATGNTTLISIGVASGTQAGPALPPDLSFCGEAEFNPMGNGYCIGWVLSGSIPAQTQFLTFESGSLSMTGTSPLVTGTFTAPAGSTVAAAADIDGDGNPDLILAGPDNAITFWLLNGFTVVAQISGPTLPAGFEIVGVDSLASNGQLDFLLWNPTNGETEILALNGTKLASTTAGLTIPAPLLAAGWKLMGVNVYTNTIAASGAVLPNWLLYNASTQAIQIWNVQGADFSSVPGPVVPAGMTLIGTK